MNINFRSQARRTSARRGIAAVASLMIGSALVLVSANQASAAAGCSVAYSANSWSTGFTANVTITNLGDALTSWKLEWDYAGNQAISGSWNSTYTQSGQHVTLSNAGWNGNLGTNGTANPGFQGTYSGTNANPTTFKLNGVTCNGGTTSPTASAPGSPSASVSVSPSRSVSPSASVSQGPVGPHVDNPYVGGKGYINPEWKAKAEGEPGGSRVSSNPTAVWLDRIAAIAGTTGSVSNGPMGLRAHLDAALAQGASYAQFVIYDLPGRDCAALASNGELGPTEIGRYQTEYIDPIAAIQADAKYRGLRIINIIEIDSLPNLVTNAGGSAGSTDACAVMKANGNYQKGIAYALGKLHAISNVYNYIDAAHHGWIGWSSNFGPSADLFAATAKMATGGVNTVDGFITDTANYSALTEPFFNINTTVNGTSVRQSKFVDWNDYVDELTFAQAFRNKLVSVGFNSNIGMLIDTSRNGWGGPNRPTKASTSTDLNTFINESRIDRRIHAGNWCNQSGAGLGERPRSAPASGIDAYVWVKPPGESDGASSAIPNNEGKGFDRMCDPTYGGNGRNGNSMSGALPNSPLAGAWFSAQFRELLANAYPAA
jgi:cellulose 1,4-beta-cellobiosidase